MNNEEQRTREFAYQIWQSEGCPNGEDARHWEMARKLVEAESGIPTAKPAPRGRKTAVKPTDATPTKLAETLSNDPPAELAAPQAGTPEVIKKPRAPRKSKKATE